MSANQILTKVLYQTLRANSVVTSTDAVICSLNNKKKLDPSELFYLSKTMFEFKNCHSTAEFEKNILEDLVNKKLIRKNKTSKSIEYSLTDKTYLIYKGNPQFIGNNFNPLPPIRSTSYLTYLFYKRINPYVIYSGNYQKKIEHMQIELQNKLDKYRNYLDFVLFKDNSEKIKEANPHLYQLLQEKNQIWPFMSLKCDRKTERDFRIMNILKERKANKLI